MSIFLALIDREINSVGRVWYKRLRRQVEVSARVVTLDSPNIGRSDGFRGEGYAKTKQNEN